MNTNFVGVGLVDIEWNGIHGVSLMHRMITRMDGCIRRAIDAERSIES